MTIVFLAPLIFGCDCETIHAKDAKRGAEVVFRCTVSGFQHRAALSMMVVFNVDRVWKGKVGSTFEMPAVQEASGCIGFLPKLQVGTELLVYARRIDKTEDYLTIPCNFLRMRDVKDIAALGRGRKTEIGNVAATSKARIAS